MAGAGASCGTCAICLQELVPSEEAFLDAESGSGCFHHFHLQCVRRWVAAQRGGSEGRQAAAALACPLCRRPFDSAVFDCEGGAYRREFFNPGGAHRRAARPGSGAGSLALTAAHRRRRAAYALPLPPGEQAARAARVAALTPQQAQRAAVTEFVVRELQALLLQEDVQLVAQHVLGTLSNAVGTAARPPYTAGSAMLGAPPRQRQPQGLQPRRPLAGPTVAPKAAAAPAAAATAAAASQPGAAQPPLLQVVQRVRAAAAPFVFEHAERFAWEVAAFAAGGTATVAAYDRLMLQLDAAAAAAEVAAAQRQRGQPQRQVGLRSESRSGSGSQQWAALQGSGSSGDDEEEARRRQASQEIQRSDSEGYLEVLLQQGAAARRRQGPASPPAQQRDRQDDSAGQGQAGNGQAPSRQQPHDSSSRSVSRSRSRSTSCSRGSSHGGAESRKGTRRRQRGRSRHDGEQTGSGRRARRRSSTSNSSGGSSSSGGGGGGSRGSLSSRGSGASSERGRQHLKRRQRPRLGGSPREGTRCERVEPGGAHVAPGQAEGSPARGSGGSPDQKLGGSSAGGGDDGCAAGSAGCQARPELAALRQQALRALREHRQRSQRGAAGAGEGPDQQHS